MKLNITFMFVITVLSFGLISCSSTKHAKTTENNTIQSETQAEEIPAAEISSDKEPAPKIVFESKLLEFGEIGPETKADGEFKFTNEGNAVLEISKVSQCCGVVISIEKKRYEPGEKGIIEISYNANNKAGKISRNPVVFSNDPVNPELILLMTAEIVNKVVTKPESLKLFLDEDNAGCPKLTVSSTDGQAFAVRGIQSTGNCITAQVDPNYKAAQIVLDLKADAAILSKNTAGYIDIIVTHPDMSIVTLPFDVVSRFTVYPPKITKLDAEPEVTSERELFIYNKYNQEFEIESITSKNNHINVIEDSITKVNNGYQMMIQITPPQRAGKTSFNDELYIQIKNSEKLKVECSGYYNLPQTLESEEENK
ncbi:MAG: DUF1573 domain-containing protein [Sedimentisphaerales bacterium]|nr:DUF1573 domain-containing protein [Sedimentisphaerales bacterium]